MKRHHINSPDGEEVDEKRQDTSRVDNLVKLGSRDNDAITYQLHARYQSYHQFTYLGSRVVVAVQPEPSPSIKVSDYVAEFRNVKPSTLPPHIYQLASSVYFHIRRSGLDQAVLFTGETGSGKTRCKDLFIQQLAGLRNASRKETKLYQQITNAQQVLTSFATAFNNHDYASQSATYIEIQFDNKGRTIGCKQLQYILDKTRVSATRPQESNFLVFYQLLAGLSDEEKATFQLNTPSHHHYVSNTVLNQTQSDLSHQFHALKTCMRSLGFTKKFQSQLFQVLAAILHLGNIRFTDHTKPNSEDAASITNEPVLTTTADLLGLLPETLESILLYKTKAIKKEVCTIFLNAHQAVHQRNDLATCLYSLLVGWINEHINSRLCFEQPATFIGLLDVPGVSSLGTFHSFCKNFMNERILNYIQYQIFEASNDAYSEDGITIPTLYHNDNTPLIHLFTRAHSGLVATLQKQANRTRGNDATILQAFQRAVGTNNLFSINNSLYQFTIQHYFDSVVYDVTGFMEQNLDETDGEFAQVFQDEEAVGNAFVAGLFQNTVSNFSNLREKTNPKPTAAGKPSSLPKRRPTTRRSKVETSSMTSTKPKPTCLTSQLQLSLDDLFDAFDNSEVWFVLCLGLGPGKDSSEWSSLYSQVDRYGLSQIAERKQRDYTVCYLHEEFVGRYQSLFGSLIDPSLVDGSLPSRQVCTAVQSALGWHDDQVALGNQFIYLHDDTWTQLERHLRATERGEQAGGLDLPTPNFLNDDEQSVYSDDDSHDSITETETQLDDFDLTREVNQLELIEEESNKKPPKTCIRKWWLCCTWSVTWWIPSFFLTHCGRMKRRDIRLAWREKVTLCFIIFTISAAIIMFIVGINPLMCPSKDIYSEFEVNGTSDDKKEPLFFMYGRVYDFFSVNGMKHFHYQVPSATMQEMYAGKNLEFAFPIQINPNLCVRYDGQEIHQQVALTNFTADPMMLNHDHRWYRGEGLFKPYWFEDVIRYRMKKKGEIAIAVKELEIQAARGRKWFYYEDTTTNPKAVRVYDFTRYLNSFILNRFDEDPVSYQETKFLGPTMDGFIQAYAGKNATLAFNQHIFPDNPLARQRVLQCMNNLFYAGVIDDRFTFQCAFAQYFLLALSVALFAILFVKFIASLQLGSRPTPEDHDKFVICNVPCYTEDEDSLKRTIDSLAVTKYDDKRKLLLMVADGMVVGGGNDLPTPRILLDLLGTDPNLDPEPLSFLSLGEGGKQHNMAKVYTGLYEIRGHIVPYMVIIKVGRPSERNKPGNRGKRDSQLILMRFFNKVHYDHPMVPLELEMYHQIKNVIGVDPHFYEFILMVDADTVVMPDSLNRLVSAMMQDTKIMGVCGETSLMNEKDSWATMIQVYEYYISHYLSKSFESLFGSVTCLPGCFSMYRMRAAGDEKPLLIHDSIIHQYSENRVDTLHKKNLLHLGEDRYLTTLLLKNFPYQKMTFTPDAKCITNAPDTWEVLLSQRRRWINSTVHNLLELSLLQQLCGFCCFSMRFVVLLDLISTVIMPATLGYLGYLLYRLATDRNNTVHWISLFFIIAPFVLQMIVFLIRRQWAYIGWMVIYLAAMPIFAFFIPLYSFWNFDDFSWGNTRVVLGDNGKKKLTLDEPPFDPDSIPTRRWSEYEEQWETKSEKSHITSNSSVNSFPRLPPLQNASPTVFATPKMRANESPFHAPMTMIDSRSGSALSYRSIPMHPLQISPTRSGTPIQSLPSPIIPILPSYRPPHSYPSPSEIIRQIKAILAHSDLMALSKKHLRDQLIHQFGVDFHPYKDQINSWLDLIIHGQL